ncbi:hypothetical protein [Sphaerisporangium dianthi]|uniref:Acyltransferase n=1 Tax=Sphaerisporangium dianthi TaxID=1436120 RepID=A0ABV9CEP1_9ACTN
MRVALWTIVGVAIAATVARYALSIAMGLADDTAGATVLTVVSLAAGGWLAGRAVTRRIGLVFVVSGLLGSIEPVFWLWERVGPPFPEIGNEIGFDGWLTYWVWIPQVLLIPLIAMSLYPDGRVRRRSVMAVAAAAVVTASFTGATHNWPRSDGGAHGNPLSLPLGPARLLLAATPVLVAIALMVVLVSLVARRPAGDQVTRRLLLIPYAVAAAALLHLSSMRFLPDVARDLRWTLVLLVAASAVGLSRATDAQPEPSTLSARS